jgi:hypothetical protein
MTINLDFKRNLINLYEYAIEKKIPVNFIVSDNNNLYQYDIISQVKDHIEKGDSLINIYELYQTLGYGYKDIMMIYYKLYKELKPETPDNILFSVILDFNTILKMTLPNDIESFKIEYNEWLQGYDQLLINDEIVYQQLLNILQILKSTELYEISPVKFTYVNLNCTLRYRNGDIPLSKEGIDIFNNSLVSINIPFIQYKTEINNYYKISKKNAHDIRDDSNKGNKDLINTNKDNINTIIHSPKQTDMYNTIYMTIWSESDEDYTKSTNDSYLRSSYNIDNNNLKLSIKLNESQDYKIIFNRIENALKGATPESDLIIDNVEESNYSADFYIYDVKYDDITFYNAIINNNVLNEYFYMDESDKPFAFKKRLKLFYKSNSVEKATWISLIKMTAGTNEMMQYQYVEGDKEYMQTRKILSGTNYIKVTISKANSKENIDELYYLIPRILKYYNKELRQELKDTISLFIPEYKDYEVLDTTKVESKRNKSNSNIKQLEELAPDLVPGKYAREVCQCKRQPKLIDASEIPEWSAKSFIINNKTLNHQVMAFPPDDPKWYLVCTNNAYPYPGVKPNPYGGVYPYLPCCFSTDQMTPSTSSHYNVAFRGEIPKDKSNKKKEILRVGKTLLPNRYGELPTIINTVLKKAAPYNTDGIPLDGEFYRYGVEGNENSLLFCIFEALSKGGEMIGFDDPSSIHSEEKRMGYVKNYRRKLVGNTKINLSVSRQELYDFTEKEIRTQLENVDTFLDPSLYYRILEELFNINIFTFISPQSNDSNYGSIELPRNKLFHARTARSTKYSILIFKHWDHKINRLGIPKCDLIVFKSNDGSITKIFNSNMSVLLNNMILNLKETISWTIDPKNIQPTARKNIYSSIDYYQLLTGVLPSGTYKFEGQFIDGYGKCRGFLINYNSQSVSIICPPFQPENLPIYKSDPSACDMKIVFELFGNSPSSKHVNGDGKIVGLWYPILDIDEGIYIPIKEESSDILKVPNGSENPFYISGINNVNRLRKLNRMKNIILQLCQWVYIYYRLYTKNSSLDTFMEGTIAEFNTAETDTVYIYNFDDLNRILPKFAGNKFENSIKYLEKVCPTFVKGGKIQIYSSRVIEGIKYYLKIYEDSIKGKKIDIDKSKKDTEEATINDKGKVEHIGTLEELSGMFDEESDFKSYSNSYLFINESDLNTWIYTRTRLGLPSSEIVTKISFDYSSYKDPYLYKDEYGNIFMIQNVLDFDFARAINVCYNWYSTRINDGYEAEKYIIPTGVYGYPRYVINELSANGGLLTTEDKTGGDKEYLRLFKYGIDKYAAILPLL